MQLKEASSVQLEIRMVAVPVKLEGITNSTERRRVRLEEEGYYRRRDSGFGYFFGPEDVQDYRPFYTTDLLRQVPGALVRPSPTGFGSTVTFRGLGPWDCSPRFVVNDWGLAPGFTLDELVHPDAVMAVEVYPSGVGAPIRYRGSRCGVVLVWTC